MIIREEKEVVKAQLRRIGKIERVEREADTIRNNQLCEQLSDLRIKLYFIRIQLLLLDFIFCKLKNLVSA